VSASINVALIEELPISYPSKSAIHYVLSNDLKDLY
jgi:hypothetical protein